MNAEEKRLRRNAYSREYKRRMREAARAHNDEPIGGGAAPNTVIEDGRFNIDNRGNLLYETEEQKAERIRLRRNELSRQSKARARERRIAENNARVEEIQTQRRTTQQERREQFMRENNMEQWDEERAREIRTAQLRRDNPNYFLVFDVALGLRVAQPEKEKKIIPLEPERGEGVNGCFIYVKNGEYCALYGGKVMCKCCMKASANDFKEELEDDVLIETEVYDEGDRECCVCCEEYSLKEKRIRKVASCGHHCCEGCWKAIYNKHNSTTCPMCRAELGDFGR